MDEQSRSKRLKWFEKGHRLTLSDFWYFSGTERMALLAFLHDLVEAFDDRQVSEAAAVQVLDLWLTDRAKSVYDSLIRNGRSTMQS